MTMDKLQQQIFLIAYTVDRMTEFLIEDYKLEIPKALQFIYNSDTYHNLRKQKTDSMNKVRRTYMNY